MRNGDMPINPIFDDRGFPSHTDFVCNRSKANGLTKREYFAGLALQCHIANNPNMSDKALAIASIESADALLEELEK